MAHPTSFRLPPDLLARIDDEAAEGGTTVTALVTSLLDEGLRTRRFPGIAFRDGPTGRRAGIVGGPDVWEVIRRIRQSPGTGEHRITRVAREAGVSAELIRAAVEYYAAFPDEVDERIALDERATERTRRLSERRAELLSG